LGFRKLVDLYMKAGEAWPAREEGEKYRITCPWGDEHASGGKGDTAFIADPIAAKERRYTFYCASTTCKAARDEKRRTFDQALVKTGVMELVDQDLAANDANMVDAAMEEVLFAGMKASGPVVVTKPKPASTAAGSMKKDKDDSQPLKMDLGVKFGTWETGWHYSVGESVICRPGSNILYKQQDFNAVFGKRFYELPIESKKGAKTAWNYVQNVTGLKAVAATAYACGKEQLFMFEGNLYLNLFNVNSIPTTAKDFTADGLRAVQIIERHIRNLAEDYDKYLLSYIAMNVQRPGELIGFCPIIKGIEGDGKTIIGQQLMAALLGAANVSMVAGDLVTEHSGWAKGHAFVCIEEIKAPNGESRYKITNKLKPYITNFKVDVVDKYIKRHTTLNATNYIGLTNFIDALPLDDGSRRWLVIFTRWKNIDELREHVGGDLKAYFDEIIWAISTQAEQLRKYFMEYQICEGWHWNMRAPDTEAKQEMIAIEESDSVAPKIKAYLEHGEYGVCKDAVSTSMLAAHLYRDTGQRGLNTRKVAITMTELGYHRAGEVRWDDATHTVYVRDKKMLQGDPQMVRARIRKSLDGTLTDENKKNYVPVSQKRHEFW
jgi:hypothetical protein